MIHQLDTGELHSMPLQLAPELIYGVNNYAIYIYFNFPKILDIIQIKSISVSSCNNTKCGNVQEGKYLCTTVCKYFSLCQTLHFLVFLAELKLVVGVRRHFTFFNIKKKKERNVMTNSVYSQLIALS